MNLNIKRSLIVAGAGLLLVFAVVGFWGRSKPSVTNPFIAHTIYGDFEVTEPVLIDLFKSPVMERIKHVRQYGVSDYVVKQPCEYTRYEHCVGVWALLRMFGASLEEQIAGLLHDASHTVFSHVGDILFRHHSLHSSYQDDIHEWYLKQQKVDEILAKHNMSLEAVLHKSGTHTMLEQDLPEVCGDRYEYNLFAGILTKMLSRDEVKEIVSNTRYEEGRWFFTDKESAKKLALVSLFNSEHVWGGPYGYFIYLWTADALSRALEIGLITMDDIHFSTDDIVWGKLWVSDDPVISKNLEKIVSYKKIINVTTPDEGQVVVKSKCRGINPWVKQGESYVRLADLDQDYQKEYDRVKSQVTTGWGVTLSGFVDNEVKESFNLVVA